MTACSWGRCLLRKDTSPTPPPETWGRLDFAPTPPNDTKEGAAAPSFGFHPGVCARVVRSEAERTGPERRPSDDHHSFIPKLPACGGALLQAALSGALGRRRKASAAPIRNTPVLAANDPNGSFVGPSDFSLDRERPVSLFQGKEKWGVHPSSPVWGQNRS